MQLQKTPIDPRAERQKAELRKAGGQAMIPLAPAGQSLADEQAAELEAQAAELRAQGGQASIPLAEGLTQPVIETPQVEEQVERAPAQAEVAPTGGSGLMAEAAALERQGQEAASILDKQQQELAAKEIETENQKKLAQEEIDAKIKEIDAIKIEPKSFYAGMSTGQKISAGIAHFFAALTPQGAQAAIGIIDNAIQRDMDAQRANLGKKQSTLSDLEKKLGSIGAAESAFRVKSLQNIELQLKSTSEKAKGPLARAKAQQGMEALQASKAKAQQDLALELMKIEGKKGGDSKLSGEQQKRLDNSRDALNALNEMDSALGKGQNTFSLVGDTDYTFAEKLFVESLARMQTGAAITKEEEKMFRGMVPRATDSGKIQQKKLADLKRIMRERITGLGRNPDQEISGLKDISFRMK